MFTFLAQQSTPLGTLGGTGLGPFATGFPKPLGETFADAISAIIGFMTVVAGLFFIFQFLIGAIQWLASGGEKAGLQQAQQKLSNAFIGFVLVVAAVAIFTLLGEFLGFRFLNVADLINLIGLPGGQ